MNETLLFIVIAYMLFTSLVLFVLMGIDKKRAVRHEWRIKESALFLIAFIGGAPGGVAGMCIFRHKTKHLSFVVGMPLLAAANIGIAFLLLYFNAKG